MFLIFVLLLVFTTQYYINDGNSSLNIDSFSFGSCYNSYLTTRVNLNIFDTMLKVNPDLFIWLGDVTYLDNINYDFIFGLEPKLNEDEVKLRFDKSFNQKTYKNFREKKPIIGIWDDHDYGYNNAKSDLSYKEIIKQIFLSFLDEPSDSKRRISGRPIYTSYSFKSGGGDEEFKSFKVILLDLRYDKTNTYLMNEEQWKWLEEELKSNETFTFIVTGIEFLPINRFFGFMIQEMWYKADRQRLISLIGKLKKSGVVILSGDVHYAQILRTTCIHEEIGYHIYEFTSSGLSHYSFGIADILIEYLLFNDYRYTKAVDDMNFGYVKFKWGNTKEESSLELLVYDIKKTVRTGIEIEYNELIYKEIDNIQEEEFICKKKFNSSLPERTFTLDKRYLVYLLVIFSIFQILKIMLKLVLLIVNFIFSRVKSRFLNRSLNNNVNKSKTS